MIELNNILSDYDFFTGVPDSGLKEFIANIDDKKHIPATNEGQAIGIAVLDLFG